ncbi:hypothetical protein SABIM44S_02312 [Streptomyces abikoensis]
MVCGVRTVLARSVCSPCALASRRTGAGREDRTYGIDAHGINAYGIDRT